MDGPGSDRSARSIDYLVNRVRTKLGNDRQAPRFIGTRYGEMYVSFLRRRPAPRPRS